MRDTRITWTAGFGFALLWVAVALIVDGTTFHLAPLIVAAAVPFAGADARVGSAGAGFALALAVTLLLSAAGRLDGPSLLPVGGAAVESVVAAAAGAALGLALAVARNPARAEAQP